MLEDNYRELVIEMVKSKPILWDPEHQRYREKDEKKRIWDNLNYQLQQLPNISESNLTAKATWDLLMRGFSNALRRKRKRIGTKFEDYRVWRFENQMNFLMSAKQYRQNLTGRDEADTSTLGSSAPNSQAQPSNQGSASGNGSAPATPSGGGSSTAASLPQGGSDDATGGHTHRLGEPGGKRKRSDDHDDEEAVEALKQLKAGLPKDSPRLGFFRSIMDMVDALDGHQFMNFQMDVIAALRKQTDEAQQKESTELFTV